MDLGKRVALCSLQLEKSLLSNKDPAQPKIKVFFFKEKKRNIDSAVPRSEKSPLEEYHVPALAQRITMSHVSSLTLDRVVRQNWGKWGGFGGRMFSISPNTHGSLQL